MYKSELALVGKEYINKQNIYNLTLIVAAGGKINFQI
jgi:hypothetical protein